MKDKVATRVAGVTATQKIVIIRSNQHSVYAGSNNGFVHKINGVEVSQTTQIEGH